MEAEPNSGLPATAFDDIVVDKLMGVASHLVELGVGLVGCQKCVHPRVKDYLRQNVSEKTANLDMHIHNVAFSWSIYVHECLAY